MLSGGDAQQRSEQLGVRCLYRPNGLYTADKTANSRFSPIS